MATSILFILFLEELELSQKNFIEQNFMKENK
jgi:hypothetical protein